MSEYIPVTKILGNVKVYQVQPQGDGKVVVMHVGNMSKVTDIYVHKIVIRDMQCFMVSNIYDEKGLKEGGMAVISFIFPNAILSVDFIPKGEICFDDLISIRDNVKIIEGKFIIGLHLNTGKVLIIDENYEYENRNIMMVELMEYAQDDDIIDIVTSIKNIS